MNNGLILNKLTRVFICASNSLFSSSSNQSAIALFTQTCSNKFSSEIKAEDHFKCNVYRDDLGRFVVRLPFVQDPSVLGDSRFMAQQRFYNLVTVKKPNTGCRLQNVHE